MPGPRQSNSASEPPLSDITCQPWGNYTITTADAATPATNRISQTENDWIKRDCHHCRPLVFGLAECFDCVSDTATGYSACRLCGHETG